MTRQNKKKRLTRKERKAEEKKYSEGSLENGDEGWRFLKKLTEEHRGTEEELHAKIGEIIMMTNPVLKRFLDEEKYSFCHTFSEYQEDKGQLTLIFKDRETNRHIVCLGWTEEYHFDRKFYDIQLKNLQKRMDNEDMENHNCNL